MFGYLFHSRCFIINVSFGSYLSLSLRIATLRIHTAFVSISLLLVVVGVVAHAGFILTYNCLSDHGYIYIPLQLHRHTVPCILPISQICIRAMFELCLHDWHLFHLADVDIYRGAR